MFDYTITLSPKYDILKTAFFMLYLDKITLHNSNKSFTKHDNKTTDTSNY